MKSLFRAVVNLLKIFVVINTIVRLVRHFYKFPMPEWMANFIDNPLRREVQPPEAMPTRHGLKLGQTVLEVGPGNGRYSAATARFLGEKGKLVAVDIEPRMIERLQARVQAEGLTNVEAKTANVHALPFEDASFDAVYMITVIGEIPQPERAIAEFFRVLRPGGTLAFSELLLDPDYPLASTLMRWAGATGFTVKSKAGDFFAYSIVFEKVAAATAPAA